MNNLEIYINMYYYELDTKEKINSRITIPIGIVTLFGGGLGYFLKIIRKLPNKIWVGFFIIIIVIYIISVIASIIFVLLTYCGYSYKYLTAEIIRDFELNIKKYYEDNYEEYYKDSGVQKEELKENDFREKFIEKYIEACECNMKLNEQKLKYLRKTGWMTLISLISGSLAYMFLVFNNIV